jgi:hypothetical protein
VKIPITPSHQICGTESVCFYCDGPKPRLAVYSRGFQPGVRVPPGVREDILEGTRKHLTGYVKLKKNQGQI